MHRLNIFENEKFGKIRVLIINGEIWFIGRDIASVLKYSNTSKAIRDHIDPEDKLRERIVLSGQKREAIIINESGLYSLILSSKLENAKKFKRWVTSEVLPTIRKNGDYITNDKIQDILNNPESLYRFSEQILKIMQSNKKLELQITELKAKAIYFDTLVDNNLLLNIRTTAKEIGVKPMRFTQFLLDKKYIFRDAKENIHPMQKYVHSGLFEIKEFSKNGHFGIQTLITTKGRNHFLKLLMEYEII